MPATKDQIEAARAQETETELEDTPYVTVPLAGFDGVVKDVRTLPAGRWRASAFRALNSANMDAFMELVLHEDDYEIYTDLDPDMDSLGRFAEAAARTGGDDLGKSSGRSRSGNGTRRR